MTIRTFQKINYLMLESNSSCNLECKSCNRKELARQGLREAQNLSEAELISILDQLKSCPIETIKFAGLSEPMLHPRFDRLAKILRGYFPNAFIIIATNLMYAPERSPLLETLPSVNQVYLSIDGVGETYERLRTGASYDRLLRSLEQLQKRVTETVRAEKLYINFTLSDENYLELPQVYELNKKYGLAGVRINLEQNWSSTHPSHPKFSQSALSFVRQFAADLKGVGGWEFKDCFWPFNGIVIDVHGNVRQCVINTDMKPLGNVFEKSIAEIYDSEAYLNIREKLLKNCPAESCKGCSYHELSATLKSLISDRTKPRARLL
jgi:radical SAM protein with 4Fe4S-binding SPASM domain